MILSPNISKPCKKAHRIFWRNLVARATKNQPETNPYMKKFLANSLAARFGFCVCRTVKYPAYGMLDKRMIQLIMWLTKIPTDTSQTYDFTAWQQVDHFAQAVIELTHSRHQTNYRVNTCNTHI